MEGECGRVSGEVVLGHRPPLGSLVVSEGTVCP